jgi:outer membrane protein assembly factor BamE (lipoprotein component of BamABCDE complex)
MKLELGMTKEQVMQIMGKPDFTEAYQKPGGVSEILFYSTKQRRVDTYRRWPDENITKDECTPVVFEHGKLIGWGDEYHQRKPKVEFEIKR